MIRRQKVPIYAKAPMTNRPGDRLARYYGFGDAQRLARALPLDSKVADFGAGASDLGKRVTKIRGDITWTNIDLRYKNDHLRKKLSKNAPPNLRFVPGNVLDLSSLPDDRYDRIFSYWLMPHLSLDGRETSVRAARNMLSLLEKDGGEIAIGPDLKRPSEGLSPGTGVSYTLAAEMEPDTDINFVAEQIADYTSMPPKFGAIQAFTNRLGHGLFYSSEERVKEL